MAILPIAYAKYSQSFNKKITLNIRKPKYTVEFYSNRDDGNADEVKSQDFVYGTKQKLKKTLLKRLGNSLKIGIQRLMEQV